MSKAPKHPRNDIALCELQYLLDHPNLPAALIPNMSISTVQRIRQQLYGSKYKHRKGHRMVQKQTPQQLAADNDWSLKWTAVALERAGYTDWTTGRMVKELGCK